MSSQNKRKAPWENQGRHYCEFCNVWMGSDRQSILLHENGKKHQDNIQKRSQERRQAKEDQDRQARFLHQTLQQMEANSVLQAEDLKHFQHEATVVPAATTTSTTTSVPALVTSKAEASAHIVPQINQGSTAIKQEKDDWDSRKRSRKGDASEDETILDPSKQNQKYIAPDEGWYSYDDSQIFLEGQVYGSSLLEEDVPIQFWTGPLLANAAEKKLVERSMYWKDGIVAAMRRSKNTVDVSFLSTLDATEESIEKNVSLDRIRIVLGADASVPETLEEARLLAMGGEEIQIQQSKEEETFDEATGFTSWSTVSIKRSTVRQELKEERERLRQHRKEAKEAELRLKKEAEARRMEEAKVANADDSALGAFDVWNRNQTGYKGIDISAEAQTTIHDYGKKLASGTAPVSFKKPSKLKKKNTNRRTTSADDD